MENNDLWPSFDDVPTIRSPKTILLEQAKFLNEKTKNILNGKVGMFSVPDGRIGYEFNVVAPVLKNYSYKLFSLYHDIFYYPASIYQEGYGSTMVNDEKELLDILKSIFSSDNTKKVITSLLGQSKEADELPF